MSFLRLPIRKFKHIIGYFRVRKNLVGVQRCGVGVVSSHNNLLFDPLNLLLLRLRFLGLLAWRLLLFPFLNFIFGTPKLNRFRLDLDRRDLVWESGRNHTATILIAHGRSRLRGRAAPQVAVIVQIKPVDDQPGSRVLGSLVRGLLRDHSIEELTRAVSELTCSFFGRCNCARQFLLLR